MIQWACVPILWIPLYCCYCCKRADESLRAFFIPATLQRRTSTTPYLHIYFLSVRPALSSFSVRSTVPFFSGGSDVAYTFNESPLTIVYFSDVGYALLQWRLLYLIFVKLVISSFNFVGYTLFRSRWLYVFQWRLPYLLWATSTIPFFSHVGNVFSNGVGLAFFQSHWIHLFSVTLNIQCFIPVTLTTSILVTFDIPSFRWYVGWAFLLWRCLHFPSITLAIPFFRCG